MGWLLAGYLALAVGNGSCQDRLRSADLETRVATRLNTARSRPQELLLALEAYKASFSGKVALGLNTAGVRTREGARAVDDAIRFIRSQAPQASLVWDADLAVLAADHADDQARTGLVGHRSSAGDSFRARVAAAHRERGFVSELISYGENTDEGVVRQLIIDDGEPSRAHRTGLYNRSVRRIGVACRPHPAYRYSCVIDLADG